MIPRFSYISFLLALLALQPAYAQEEPRRFGVDGGVDFGAAHFAVLGIGYGALTHPALDGVFLGSNGLSASCAVRIGDRPLIAPQIGGWFGMPFCVGGLNLAYYTDFRQGAWRLRPEVGIELASGRITYGYNIPLSNKEMPGVNTHQLSFRVFIPVK